MFTSINIIILCFLITIVLLFILVFRVKWREIFALFLIPLAKTIPPYILPNHITALSFLFTLAAGIFIYLAKYDHFFFLWVIVFLLLFAVVDTLDGFLARTRNQITKSGSFLDYTLDKLSYLFLLFTAILGGHIKTELIVTTMLLSLFYNLIDMESQALSESKSSLTEHSRWLVPAIILCLIAFFSKFFQFEPLVVWEIKFQLLDALFLILPIFVFAAALYKIMFLWKNLRSLDQF